MDCEEIKSVIPKYFNHTASEEEIKSVEEHLCVCHDCRNTLGELMDKLAIPEEAAEPKELSENSPEPIPEPAASTEPKEDMEYVPGAADISQEVTFREPEPEIKEVPAVSEKAAESLPEKTEETLTPSKPEPGREEHPEKEEALSEPEPVSEPEKEEFPLDDIPLDKSKAGIFEYSVLIVGVAIFGALLYLLLAG